MMKITKKELNKHINVALRKAAKKYEYKTRGGILYKQVGDYFVSTLVIGAGIDYGKIVVRSNIKPYFFDDIFWEIFQMSENSEASPGLRANGAFSVSGLPIFEQNRRVDSLDDVEAFVEDMLKACDVKIRQVLSEVDSDYRRFIAYAKDVEPLGLYDAVLSEMLLNIEEGDCQAASRLATSEIENNRYGRFKNEGKYIYEHVVGFCKNK